MNEFDGKAIVATQQMLADMKRLNGLRRDFSHFNPMGWSIEIGGLPRIIGSALQTIAALVDHPAITVRMDKESKQRIDRSYSTIQSTLAALEAPPFKQ